MLPGDNNMNEVIINSQDIREAEFILGLKERFDDQRQKVIKCLESKDIVACPGSGKTTTLLAKLIILAAKMPFPDNKGICVLTHTNVAINEIKDKLGSKASLLLSYPNFVGTIQSFVDRYFAIPACIKKFGVRPRIFEENDYGQFLVKKFRSKYSWNSKLNTYLYLKIDDEIKKSKSRKAIQTAKEEILKSLRMDYISLKIKRKIEGNEIVFLADPNNDSYKEYQDLVVSLMEEGIISYNDAYGLALMLIDELGEEYLNLFSERFLYVFVDEMQDTDEIQMNILNKIFGNNKVIIQCYGDPNQAIYDFLGSKECGWIPEERLSITNSKRFHNNIAYVSDFVSLPQCRYKMRGIGESQIPPIIITYTNDDVSNVLEYFAKLIIHYKLTDCEKPVFKAVGMVRGKDNKLGIKSYFPLFEKTDNSKNSNKDYSTLCQYLVPVNFYNTNNKSTGIYYNRFINAILKTLRLANIKSEQGKFFTKSSLLRYLYEQDPMLLDLMNKLFVRLIIRIEKGNDVTKYFRNFLKAFIKRVFNTVPNEDAVFFLEGNLDLNASETSSCITNVYEYEGVKIEIDTVHGVKGQTHTATLYMETFWNKKNVANIIEYIRGESKKNPSEQVKKQLKIAYVAMTRPKELLCITMEDAVFEQNKDKLTDLGWVHYNDILKSI